MRKRDIAAITHQPSIFCFVQGCAGFEYVWWEGKEEVRIYSLNRLISKQIAMAYYFSCESDIVPQMCCQTRWKQNRFLNGYWKEKASVWSGLEYIYTSQGSRTWVEGVVGANAAWWDIKSRDFHSLRLWPTITEHLMQRSNWACRFIDSILISGTIDQEYQSIELFSQACWKRSTSTVVSFPSPLAFSPSRGKQKW